MGQRFNEFKEALKREEVRSISRRYFFSNGFDGTLTATGITVGSYISGVPDGLTVFKIGVGAAIGLATSGVWSVWEIERAEKLAEIHEIEENMLTELEDTKLHRRKKQGITVNALMSGLGPIISILLVVSPFLMPFLSLLQMTIASVLVGVALLFCFGAYMASISKQEWYVAGLRMGLAGLVVAALNILLPG
ncbi:MAG: VIT1/CCC1 transporter family protein [Candidatus Nanohalobium sp.]